MSRSCILLIAFAGTLWLADPTLAQSPPAKSNTPSANIKSDAKAEADRLGKERRTEARSVLLSLATDARSFQDQILRTRSLSQIADALWTIDPERGRTLFRQAWEAVEMADVEKKQRLKIRTAVLTLAATRDRKLADEFLQKVKEEPQETTAQSSRSNLWELSEASQQRLNLAETLLQAGDVARALQFADPVLNNVTISNLDFLTRLRAQDPAAADQRYATLLNYAGGSALTDANTISLLSSYIFTPRLYVTFDNYGAADSSSPPKPLPPPNVSAQLRLSFFQIASGVLLRAQPAPEQDQSTTGLVSKYMAIKRLLPLFEQYAPRDLTEALRAHFDALNSQIGESVHQAELQRTQPDIGVDKPPVDREPSLLDQIDHAKNSDERDDLYFRLALIALDRDDAKARDYAGKIDNGEFRKQAQTWVDWGLATKAVNHKQTEGALGLARNGELSHIQKVRILTQSAKLLAKADLDQALILIDEATTEARRIDGGDLDRPRAFLAIANALNVIAPARVWAALFDAAKAANSAENFKGEGAVLTVSVTGKSQILRKTDAVADFDLEGVFRDVANKDFERAIQLARGFREEAPRANATLAICRAVLN